MLSRSDLQTHDAVLAVDVQVDFCPGGSLPIPRGDEVVPELNPWLAAAAARGLPAVLSRDWHPEGHPSFTERGGPWPRHCVQDTPGAAFHPALLLPPGAIKVSKGVRFDKDQSSAFDETGLALELRRRSTARLFVGGLALEVCVLASVLDARLAGFDVVVLGSACRPVSAAESDRALGRMRAAGARLA